jgi:hypothetical protein
MTRIRRHYRGECERIESQQLRTGTWIREHLPPGARVATHDVGAIAFAGERPVVDLVGLVTPGLAGAYRHGEGAIWEALDALPPAERPTHAAVIPEWMPYLKRTRWMRERLWASGGSGSSARDFEVWTVAWPESARGTGILGNVPAIIDGGWKVVDAVDVGDLRSEREHDYVQDPRSTGTQVRELGFAPGDRSDAVGLSAIEGGREAGGLVRFSMQGRPARPALLVLRCSSGTTTQAEVRIGPWRGTLEIPVGETVFSEVRLAVPAGEVGADTGGRIEVTVRGEGFLAYHWWLLQAGQG